MNDGTATDRASELGTAHGKAAAEALVAHCLDGPNADEPAGLRVDEDGGVSCRSCWNMLALPVPDLIQGDELDDLLGPLAGPIDGDAPTFPEIHQAFCTAFTAAVEATVREAVR